MKKQLNLMGLSATIFLSIVALNQVNAQNFDALRYQPDISEDEMIFCVKDVQHKGYEGQISCFISPSDDLLDQKTSDKIYNKASSLDDTFEMGLVD
jgi:hypothetical protein